MTVAVKRHDEIIKMLTEIRDRVVKLEDKVDAVGVADEVVIEAIVALLPRELPQGYIGHP